MKKFIVLCLSIITFSMFSCKLWMSNDDFFTDIEKEVKVAKAEKINVYVGFAQTQQGQTTPNGLVRKDSSEPFKVGVPKEISYEIEPEYGFKEWLAFSTSYFTTNDKSKNKDICFVDKDSYKNVKAKALDSSIVSFEKVYKVDDEGNKVLVPEKVIVTIKKSRDDICIVPIVAERPIISRSTPSDRSEQVIKNMSVRINFSKPMNPISFNSAYDNVEFDENEENTIINNEYDRIIIEQGVEKYTSEGEPDDFDFEDITDHFDVEFSSSKKMITLKFKEDYISEGYASQSSVVVTIKKEVEDEYGFQMANDSKISFNVGSKKDSLAPRITWLSAGTGNNFEAFQGVYKDVGSLENLGQKTKIKLEGASLAPSDNIEDPYYNDYIANRIGQDSKLVLHVYAEDLAGAGSGQSLDGVESDVKQIGIRARHLYNADGTPDTESKFSDPHYELYVPQQNNTSLDGSFRELVKKAYSEASISNVEYFGSLFEYDLSKMPDGLIQVDVAAQDLVNNFGFSKEAESYSSEYGNAWTTLFIVKDTTAPDAEENKDFVQADLSIVPNGRGMFNAEDYKRLAVIESTAGIIKDKGNYRLVSPNDELKWIVNPGSDTSWASSISSEDSRWKLVSSGYTPAESALPTSDGPVDFTYALMDNLGNISKAVLFKSVTYDNTKPTIGKISIEGINGFISTSITGNILENQILSIPVSDETAGLESIEISTAAIKGGTQYAESEYELPFASDKLVVKVDDRDVHYKLDGNKLTFTEELIGDAVVTIQGLQIAERDNVIDDSTYRISIKVTDAALNISDLGTADIKNDSTAPVINYIEVKDINSGIVGNSAEEYWTKETEPNTTLYINLTETNTGAKVFDFNGSSIKLTSESVLIWNEKELPIEIDTAANKLTITDEEQTVITEAAGGEVIITRVDLVEENRVNLVVSDLVTNASVAKTNFTINGNTTIDMFKYDYDTPEVKSVVLKDQAPGTGGNAETGYTDNVYIEATVNVEATASGVYQITVTGATFDSTTLVNNKQSTDAAEGFSISSNGRTITLRTKENKVNRIIKNNFDIKLSNVKLPEGDGDKTVSFTVTSVANRTSDESADTQSEIRLDTTAPIWEGEGVFVAESNAPRKDSIYPHVSTSAAENVKLGSDKTVYFYTKDVINVAADINDTNRKDGYVDLFIDNATKPVAEYKDVAPGKHTVYAVDKAGNKSAVKTFYVVGDTEGPADFEGYVTFRMPAGGNIYRGNAPTETSDSVTQNYVIKQNASPYQIIIKLGGVTDSDIDVHGNAREALSSFKELKSQTDKSLVEYYAFSTDGSQTWKSIGDGKITISLPLTGDCTPYTVYLKDGCGNISHYTVPVNWKVDGNIVHGEKDIDHASLRVNAAENRRIAYYKGITTPVLSLKGYSDTCFYPNDNTVEAGINKSEEKYTLKSRLLAWPNDSTVPSRADFDSTTIAENRFSPWSYLTLKKASDSFVMTHNYPRYDNETHTIPAYKLYYIVEDKLGNYTITQLVNEIEGTELWMYDNTAPSIVVTAGAKINTIDNKNYYSDISTLSLNITDSQSGIEWDGSTNYAGEDVQNSLTAITYSLEHVDPNADFTVKINGIKDFAQNVMPDTEGLRVNSEAEWVKQVAPTPSSASIIDWSGTQNGTSNYTSELITEDDGTKIIKVKAPRSVTGLKFGLKVDQVLADGETIDNTDLLGWIITTEPLTSFVEFYEKARADEGGDLTVLTRNGNDQYEHIYTKSDTEEKWEDIENNIQYFYAVNRAGLISHKPIIVEFVENPVPAISSRTFVDVKPFDDVNYIKESSTIRFVTSKDSQNNDVLITKCEFYIGNETTPALVKDFTSAPVTEYTLKAAETTVLPAIYNRNEQLTVKLYTATEESEKYPLTDAEAPNNLAPSNIWNYDNVAPVINRIFVSGIKAGTTNGTLTEYWTTAATPKANLYINFTDINTGAMVLDFAGSTIKITDETKVTLGGVELPITKDIENNKITIADASTVDTPVNGREIIVTDFDLAEPSAENKVSLKISDFVMNTSTAGQLFTIKNEAQADTTISQFKYDASTPTVNSVVLRDQEPGTGGEVAGVAENGYTDNEYIKATVGVTATDSGVYQITVIGASFDDTTKVNGKLASDTAAGFRVSADGKTITLRTNGDTINRIIKGTFNIVLNNVKLPSGDGDKTVSFTVTNLADRTSAVTDNATSSIRLDMTAPAWVGDGVFVAESNTSEDGTLKATIYPHTSTSANGNIKIGGFVYFYTKDTINVSASISDTNRRNGYVDLYIDNATTPVVEYVNVAPGTHTVYSVDKAGNKSAVKTFYVVEDVTGLEDFDSYITFTIPAGGDIYRGNAPTVNGSVTTQNYVIKGNKDQEHIVISDTYKIIVKLPGVAGTEKDVHGTTRAERSRYPELDPLTDKSPVEYYAYSTDGSKNWLPISTGVITIELPLEDTDQANPYTIYLKDGCSNESSFTVPVHWLVDGSVTHGGKTLGTTLYPNAAKNITYYKGATTDDTPILSLTSFNDTCYYPGVTGSTSNSTVPEDNSYTLKSRVLAWTNASSAPTKSDFYSTTIAEARFSDWQYLTLKSGSTGDSVSMQHHYPCYDVTTAYTFYYIVEDKLGNYEIYQLKNSVDSENELSFWMYDNTPPAITVGADSEKINTIDNKNYYSANSRLTLNMTDAQSGIEWDGTDHYTGNGVLNTLSPFYPLENVNPLSDSTIKVNGLKDFAQNVMGDSVALEYHQTSTWVKQTAPTLPASNSVSIIDWDGTANGTSNYQSELTNLSDGSKKISVQSPRSVTSLTFGLKITSCDDADMLGWIITTTPLENFEPFYSSSLVGTTITSLTRNNNDEYEYTYTKSNTTAKWENIPNKTQYFYAVNRAGLVCQKPIIVEFAENPVPAIASKSYEEVRTFENVNFINDDTTITFTSNKYSDNTTVVPITKAEYYIGNNVTPALTKDFTASPVTSYTLATSESTVLPQLAGDTLTVKLYTATEESEKYPLTYYNENDPDDPNNLAASNIWMFDNAAPVINNIKVTNISNGIEVGHSTEYWTTKTTPQTELYIKLTETNTGVKVFDFAGSSIKLREDTVLTWNGSALPETAVEINITGNNNKLTITDNSLTIKTPATGGEVTLTNVDLVTTPQNNNVNLVISDYVANASAAKTNFITQDETQIPLFKYDGSTPTVNSVTLRDQAPGEGGNAEDEYTNDEYVKATLNVTATDSGIYKITVSGATFDSTTKVNSKTSDDGTEGFVVSNNGTVITLKTSNNEVNRLLKGTSAFNILIENVKLPSNDGSKTVGFTVTSLAERTSDETQDAIILDKTNPVWVYDGVFVAASNATNGTLKTTIYPHSSTSASGNIKFGTNNEVYFYTKDTINVSADVNDTNRKNGNVDLFIDNATTAVAEYTNVAPGTHTIYAVDKAGNKSAEKTFHVVSDTAAPAEFDGYVTFTMPTDGDIYRGNAATVNGSVTTQNYVIKQNSNPYQIIVKLPGVAGTESDVHGETRDSLERYAELDPLSDKSPIEYFAFSTDGTTNWQSIGNGTITINLPITESQNQDQPYTDPYTIYLKDGCSNVSSYTVPVKWRVDGSVTLGGKNLSNPLYVNDEKEITYYKGTTTPVLSLTSFNDSCYYPSVQNSTSSSVAPANNAYTLKSRVIAWTSSIDPEYEDFFAEPLNEFDATRFSDWQYLTLKSGAAGDLVLMQHNYPNYDTKDTYEPDVPFELWYIVEDKLGNYTIAQLINDTNPSKPISDWMYDNTTPTIQVGSASVKVNTVDDINYYSSNSELSLIMSDTQSGIEYDGVHNYDGNDVLNIRTTSYPLVNVNPLSDSTIKVSGLKDFAQNSMPASAALEYHQTSTWVKQAVPALASTPVSVKACEGTPNGTGGNTTVTTNGTEYKIDTTVIADTATNGKRIKVKAPRSITSMKFGLKVDQTKYTATGTTTADNTELLGWIIASSPLEATQISSTAFYQSNDNTIDSDSFVRNDDDEYVYTYENNAADHKWENISNKLQYFYAVNRAGLICPNPIIIEFVENPVPGISERIITNVTPVEGINYNFLKPTSKIKFISDVEITKCEYYVMDGDEETLELTIPNAQYSLVNNNSFELTSSTILSTLTTSKKLRVKLYTANEESVKYDLTDSGYASSNEWVYDPTEPEIKRIFVEGIKESTLDGTAIEYWSTGSDKENLFITLKEANTGVRIFDFAGSTIQLTEDDESTENVDESSKLYKKTSDNSWALVSDVTIDATNNKLTIGSYAQAVKDTTGADIQIKITNVQLVSATSSDTSENRPGNKVVLAITDCASQTSVPDTTNHVHERFALDNTTVTLNTQTNQIEGFNYDPSIPSVSNFMLRDRASINVGTYAIPVDPDFTNEREVTATVLITETESGISQLIVNGASFVTSGENATTINLGTQSNIIQANIPYSVTTNNGDSIVTFNNNKVFKNTVDDGYFVITINNLQLPEYDDEVEDDDKQVIIQARNIGNKVSTISASSTDTITLDMTPPVWNDARGLYTNKTDATIYPRSANGTTKAYGLANVGTDTSANDIFFYTDNTKLYLYADDITESHYDSTSFIHFTITDGTIEESVSPTTAYGYLGLTLTSDTCRFTVYVVDKAGNKTAVEQSTGTDKAFMLVKDEDDPATIENYITFKQAMQGDVPVGQVFRGNSSQYVIRKLENNEEIAPYKIIIKLGAGVTSSDIKINGNNFTGSQNAYSELYKTTANNTNSFDAIHKAPIEYYAVTEGTASVSDDDWISIFETEPQNAGENNKLTVQQSNGEIIISLPKATTCNSLKIHLKDGCGHTSSTVISPDNSNALTWIVDDGIGDGNYAVEFNGTSNSAVIEDDDNAHVVIDNPYDITDGTGGGFAVNNGVTYYKLFGSTPVAPRLKLTYIDECVLPDGYSSTSGTEYTLRGRLIAWKGTTAPDYAQFALDSSTDEITLERAWATDWVPVVIEENDGSPEPGEMVFDFPAEKLASVYSYTNAKADTEITGSSATEPYELWYVVEDAVGNSKIMQVKNRATESSSNVTEWMYDNHAPTLDSFNSTTVPCDVTFERVNKDGSNYYYSTVSKSTYIIRDDRAGITTNSELIAIADTQTDSGNTLASKRVAKTTDKQISSMSVGTPSGTTNTIPYVDVADIIGNTARLYLTTDGNWVQQNTPTLANTAAGFTGTKGSDSVTALTTASGRFYVTKTGSTTDGIVNTLMAERAITSVVADLSSSSDQTSTELLGWVVSDTPLNASALNAFYSNSTINVSVDSTYSAVASVSQSDSTFTFDKGASSRDTIWFNWFNNNITSSETTKYKYFYAVNKAGLICQKPVKITFAENPIPDISSKTYTNIKVLNNINYIKQSSTVNFVGNKYSNNDDVYITKAEFYIDDSSTPALTKDFSSAPVTEYTLTSTETSVLPALSNSELKVKLYTDTEESDKYELSDSSHSTNNIWMYDAVAPVIDYIKVDNITNGIESNGTEYWSTENTSQTALYIKLTETNTGAKVFNFASSSIKLRNDTVVTWNGNGQSLTTGDYEIDTENNKIIIDDAKTIKTSASGGEVTIQNVDLTSATGGNTVSLTISDYVENNSTSKAQFKLGDTSTEISMFRYDGNIPTVNSVVLTDRAAGEGGDAETGFTNEEYVNATVNVDATSSGIYMITVDGAIFDSTTTVNGKSANDLTEGFEVSDNGSTIKLVTGTGSSTVNRLLKGTDFDIEIANVKLPSGDGDKNVTFTVTSLSQRTSDGTTSGAQASIKLDKTAPTWDDDGVFVATSNSDTTKIYPHSSTSTSGNVKIGGVVYFYTSLESIKVAASVTDANRKANNADLFIDSSTTPVAEYTGVTPGSHTVYAVDKAGNKSAEKTFYVVSDTTVPTSFAGYVTFAMPAIGGNIYRGNADTGSTKNYVIKQNSSSNLEYKIITKLDGVTSSDKDVNGNTRTELSGYGELVSKQTSSPIEYYKISGDSGSTENVNVDWTEMPSDHTITITLPKARNSSNITIWLKDGCGNTSSYTVPVNWKVDNGIELGSESLGSTLYLNSDKNTTYYKGDTTPVFSLTGFDDSCYYPTIETSDVSTTETTDYTLKTRVLAWSADSENPPENTDFYSTSINATRFSPWSYLTLKQSGDSVAMTHNYPKYNSTSAYKLYYIVEDKLGNYRIEQIKNGTYELWMWDNTAPSIEVVSYSTSPSININTVGDKNYYSTSSKLKLNVTDSHSGIKYDVVSTYSGSGVLNSKTVDYPLTSISPNSDGQIKIGGIKDYVDNTMGEAGPLSYNGKSTWVKQTAPTLGDTSSVSVASGTKEDALGQQSNYTSSATSPDDGSKKLTVTAPRYYTSLTISLKVDTTDTEDLLGWVIKTDALNASQLAKFYSTSDSDLNKSLTKVSNNEYKYTYNKSNINTKWETIDTQYFYAVNKAGLICQNPIIVEFTENAVPAISGNVTYTNIETVSNVNYIKTGTYTDTTTNVDNPSSIRITTTTPVANIKLKSGSTSQNFTSSDCAVANATNTYEIVPGSNWNGNLAGAKLTMILSTANEDSDLIYLTKSKTNGWTYTESEAADTWTYDATRPAFTISAVKHSDGTTAAVKNPADTGTYFVTSSSAKLTLDMASGTTDIAKYQYKLSSDSSWTDFTSDNALSAGTTAATYNIRAVDNAGNPSEPQNITVQKDGTGPSGSFTLSYKYGDTAVTNPKISASSSDNTTTVYFNPISVNKVTFTPSITDTGAGLESPYLSYKFKTDDGSWGSVTSVTESSFTKDSLAENHIYTFEIYAKDALGNTTTYTYIFNGMTPSATIAHSYLLNTTTVTNGDTQKYSESHTGSNYTIYYNHARVNKLKLDVTEITGNTVTLKRQTGSGEAQTITTQTSNGTTSGSYTFDLSDSGSATYRIFVTDIVDNELTLATFTVNGNAPGGSVGFDETNNSSAYTSITTGSTNDTVYFNHSNVTAIKLTQTDIKDAASNNLTLKYQKNSETPVDYPSTGIPCPTATDSDDGYYANYTIFAEDLLGNKTVYKNYVLNGRAPTGQVLYDSTANDTDKTECVQPVTTEEKYTVYFNQAMLSSNTIIKLKEKDISGAKAGDTIKLYCQTGDNTTNRLEFTADNNNVDENSLLLITCPGPGLSYANTASPYKIVAVDSIGNETILAEYILDGRKPSTTVTYKLTKEDGTTEVDSSYYYISGNNINYNKAQVKKFVVTVSDVAGSGTVNLTSKEGDGDAVAIQNNTCTFNLPTTANTSATYKIIATDCVANETVKEFTVTANELIGSVTFDSTNNDSEKVKYNGNKVPKEIYFKHGAVNNIKLAKTGDAKVYYQIGDATEVEITSSLELPCPSGDSYTATYKILAGDAKTLVEEFKLKGYSPSGNISIASDAVGKQTGSGDSATWAAATAAGTNAGGYILTTDTSTTPATVTIKYNPSLVNMVTLSPTVTDCGAGSKIVVRNNSSQVGSPVNYVSDVVVPVTLESNWTDYERTYDVYAVDNVGNETLLKIYKFRAYTTAPTAGNRNINYNNLNDKMVWIYDSSAVEVKGIENHEKKSGTITPQSAPNGGGSENVITNDIIIRVNISNASNLVSQKISYQLSYTYDNAGDNWTNWDKNSNTTTTWQTLQDIYSQSNKKYIDITIRPEDVPEHKTYLFVWLQDEIGNTNVYNIVNPENTTYGWWYGQRASNGNSSIHSLSNPLTGATGITTTTSSSPISIDQVPQGLTSSTFTENFADTIDEIKTVTKSKKARKGRKSAQITELAKKSDVVEALTETVSDVVAETTENVVKDTSIEETVQAVIESVTAVTETTEFAQNPTAPVPVAPSTPVETVVNAVEEVIDSVNATDNDVEVAVQKPVVQNQLYEYEDAGFDMRSVYVAIAILLVAISALVGFIISRKQKNKVKK